VNESKKLIALVHESGFQQSAQQTDRMHRFFKKVL
jgi:hypothetical protein